MSFIESQIPFTGIIKLQKQPTRFSKETGWSDDIGQLEKLSLYELEKKKSITLVSIVVC